MDFGSLWITYYGNIDTEFDVVCFIMCDNDNTMIAR